MSVHAFWSESFSVEPPVVRQMLPGASLAEMRDAMRDALPPMFDEIGIITIDGVTIPRDQWRFIRPKTLDRPVQVRFHVQVHGGDGEGGKAILATLAAIALTVATGGIAAGSLQGTGLAQLLGVSFAANSVSAYVAAGVVSVIGSNLISGLAGAPTTNGANSDPSAAQRVASASGNVLQFGASVPRVYGERRVYPPFVAQPLVTLDGQDEIVEAVTALSGPHRLSEIQIGATPVSSMPNVEIETHEGWPGIPEIRLVRRFGQTSAPNAELKGHIVDATDQKKLNTTVDVSLAVPQPAVYTADRINGITPDEFHMHVVFPQGVGRASNSNTKVRVPFRIRIRRSGEDWVNLPELYFLGSDPRPTKSSIVFRWSDEGTPIDMSRSEGWVEARRSAPGQTVVPETDAWVSDDYFWAGSGDLWINSNNLGSTGVRNIASTGTDLFVTLDPDTFTPGRYDVEIRRGCAVEESDWDTETYEVNGDILDLFWYSGTVPTAPYSRDGISDMVSVARNVTIVNRSPVNTGNVAIVTAKARNVQLEQISVLAGGYVKDWDGSAWSDWTVTSNPAPHLRDIMVSALKMQMYSDTMVDDDDLVAWRTHCVDDGHTVNAVLIGTGFDEAARIIAGCGYAQMRVSEKMGIVYDRDRSADAPVQMITPRNSTGLTVNLPYRRLPDGLRVRFDDEENDYAERTILVLRDGIVRDVGRYEEVRFEGITSEADAVARARYELRVYELRAATYGWEMSIEAMAIRRGSLVAHVSDDLSDYHGYGIVTAGGTDTVTIDTAVNLINNDAPRDVSVPFRTVGRVRDLGRQSAAQIRRLNGDVETVLLDGSVGATNVLTFADSITSVPEGALITVGPHATVSKRLVVTDMKWRDDDTASITAVPEAPEIWA